MKRSYLMRRPDDDEDYYGTETVHAKPIDERIGKKLGDSYKGKDFVKGSAQTQQQFYGEQKVMHNKQEGEGSETINGGLRPLTHDEKNKLTAKIIKAELKKNKELVAKLKKKLEIGMVSMDDHTDATLPDNNDRILMKVDKKSGVVMPARSKVYIISLL